jgi:hypothetical protein
MPEPAASKRNFLADSLVATSHAIPKQYHKNSQDRQGIEDSMTQTISQKTKSRVDTLPTKYLVTSGQLRCQVLRALPGRLIMAVGLCLAIAAARPACADVYPGESVQMSAGSPALVKFIRGEPTKPLVVLIPGAAHTARIFYGGHPGGRETDFVAYWLKQLGFNVLAISYPIHTESPVMDMAVPGFGILDWGRQGALLAKDVIEREHLSNHVVIIGWSMGGRILGPFMQSAASAGLTVDLFVSFSATSITKICP